MSAFKRWRLAGVAFGCSAVFVLLVESSSWIRGVLASPFGMIAIAASSGPMIWTVMSCALIPLFTHRPPAINLRWWIQSVGPVVFVALPMVAIVRAYRLP